MLQEEKSCWASEAQVLRGARAWDQVYVHGAVVVTEQQGHSHGNTSIGLAFKDVIAGKSYLAHLSFMRTAALSSDSSPDSCETLLSLCLMVVVLPRCVW